MKVWKTTCQNSWGEMMLSQNALRNYIRLGKKKYREQNGKFLAEGARLCEEALNSGWEIDAVLYCRALLESPRANAVVETAQQRGLEMHDIDAPSFNKLAQTMHAQGVVAVVNHRAAEGDPFEIIKQVPRCLWVAIDRLHDPGNLGSIMRTAEWLGVDGLLIGPDCVEIFNPKVVRASMGAIFHLPIHPIADLPELMRRLQQFGCFTYAADQTGDFPYTSITYAAKKILLLGDEVDGLSDQMLEVAQHRVAIPRKGHGESLNVSVAASILLAEMVR